MARDKKGKKGGTNSSHQQEDAVDSADMEEEACNHNVAKHVSSTGKTKPSKKKSPSFDDEDAISDEEPAPFSGKKGGVSGSGVSFALLADDDDDDDDEISYLSFGAKKKSSRKKTKGLIDGDDLIDSRDEPADKDEGVAENYKHLISSNQDTSKNKKKKNKKKSLRTAQEDDEDLDKILAELGEAPPASNIAPLPLSEVVENVKTHSVSVERTEQVEPAAAQKKKKKRKAGAPAAAVVESESIEDEAKVDTHVEAIETPAENEKEKDEVAESAAAKKKKKKKDKEKEKKELAPVLNKKVPKAVREMQEAISRRREEEERKKKEEEERIRKEEEERLRQEEIERQAEEVRKRKKEREKEKLLKKKLEGKLLTAKQKEEARRLEAMRTQILAMAGGLPHQDGENHTSKPRKPVYKAKKSKQNHVQCYAAADEKASDDTELKIIKKGDEVHTEMADQKIQDVEEETDDEWDAKSWDNADLKLPKLSAFDDEEVDSTSIQEVERDYKREIKCGKAPSQDAGDNLATAKSPIAMFQEDENSSRKGVAVPESTSKKFEADLRSPICCIMGHVDSGKTKLLDCIRRTNVQEGEAGGITQQIGATYFPAENIRERTKELKADATLKVPGLLVIDTPGHDSFSNLRARGSGLCDIAILVVDITVGLKPQTIESLNLLKMRNTEFIVALNKVDRLYNWKTCSNAPIAKALKQQTKHVMREFEKKLNDVITQFMEQGVNTELYYKNKEMGETFSIVPTSAKSGEGIPDLLLLLVQWTQKTMVEKLTFSKEVQCTVLEVKVVEGHGTTIDVVLVNGVLHEGDQIVVCGNQGPIVTTIRALLTPHPMRELRVKGTYLHHKEIKAAQGIKITAQGLEHAVAGTGLFVVGRDVDVEAVKEKAMEDMKSVMSRIDKTGEGVCVQASTLGSLEALLEFLKTPEVNIPVSGINIGPVHKKDVMKASVMLEKKKEYAAILAFDVKVTPEARELAEEYGVKIFTADVIYHLFDQFKAYLKILKKAKSEETADEAVFPCVLRIMPDCVINKKDPIILGVEVLAGIVKEGTPICIPQRDFIDIGRISSIQKDHKDLGTATKGQQVSIKICGSNPEQKQKMFGRHFEMEDELVSRISRNSIDALKANEHHLSKEDWRLVDKLKFIFKIQ